MKIYTLLTIGDFHTNHCEDFLVHENIGSNKKLIAVLDGCTMGTESVFASILTGKLLRKVTKKHYYQEFLSPSSHSLESELKQIIKELFSELRLAKNQLDLEVNEMLSTLIIGVIDTSKLEAELLAIGDGLIYCDGELIEYEQDDKPDYLGYHLDEDFENWYQKQIQRVSRRNFENLSICTDGVFTFKNLKKPEKQMNDQKIIDYLLEDSSYSESETMLERKVRFLKESKSHVVTDDIAIIRVMIKN